MNEFTWYELLVGALSVLGMVLTIYTAKHFKLRKWKFALYYLVSGLGIFSIYQLVMGFHIVDSALILAGLEVLFIIVITYSIYRLKATAESIGA